MAQGALTPTREDISIRISRLRWTENISLICASKKWFQAGPILSLKHMSGYLPPGLRTPMGIFDKRASILYCDMA
jgi:hypothetical protein